MSNASPARASRLLGRARARLDAGGVAWLAPVAAGLGAWLGLELRAGPPVVVADAAFFLTLAFVAPQPVAAVGALYHDPLHATLLPWPVSGGIHFGLGLRRFAASQLSGLAAVAGLAVGVSWGASPAAVTALVFFCLATYLGGLLAAVGSAGLCAAGAASDAPWLATLRERAAGSFCSGRHAPFLYLPAVAFLVAAGAALVGQAGLLEVLVERGGGLELPRHLLLLGAPLWSGAVLAGAGALCYRRFALRVIPRVIEEAKTVYGGRPAPADPPYGLGLARLLPARARPHYRRELREQARAHPALWATLALAMLLAGGYAANVGDPVAAAPVAGVVLCVWAASLPTRRTPRQAGARFTLALPRSAGAAWLGRLLALLFVTGHLALALALALGYRHGPEVGLGVVALLIGAGGLAVGATTPRVGLVAHRWGLTARLTTPLALSSGLVATVATLPVGLALAGCLLLAGVAAGLAPGGAGR